MDTKCKGICCLVKDKCKRYTTGDSEHQSWFSDEPYRIVNGKFTCSMFWGEDAESIFNQLNDIVNGESNGNKSNDTEGVR